MRVEVYDATGKERVGFLDGVADLTKSRGTTVSIEVSPARTHYDLGSHHSAPRYEPAQYVALKIDQCAKRIERELFARDPEDAMRMIASTIPAYAERIEDVVRDEILFVWPIVMVAPDNAEIVFEMDRFEPDGQSCDAWAKEDAWWAKRGRIPGSHTFDVTKAAATLSKSAEKLTDGLKGMRSPAIMDQIARQMAAIYEAPPRLIPDETKSATSFSWKTVNSMKVVPPVGLGPSIYKIPGA